MYREDGSGSFRILDPDGNKYECMQRGPDSKEKDEIDNQKTNTTQFSA